MASARRVGFEVLPLDLAHFLRYFEQRSSPHLNAHVRLAETTG
jgi:hypothetical protein